MHTLNSEAEEIATILDRLLDNLSKIVSAQTGRTGVELRSNIGDIRSNWYTMIVEETFATKLLECFDSARKAGATILKLTAVHNQLFNEMPTGEIASAIVQMATLFCMSTESRIAAGLEFDSRDDVEVLMGTMKDAFDRARLEAADAQDSSVYQNLTALAGALTDHLANVARPLARMITIELTSAMPALSISQFVYYTGDRWEEIVTENKVIHPAFCPRTLRGLSS